MATVLVTGANRGPDESAAALVRLFDRLGRPETGRFFDRHGRELPW
jgi:hypothetical protein